MRREKHYKSGKNNALSGTKSILKSLPTLLFLHFHHFSLPLIKSGDVLGVFAAHRGIRVCGDGGTRVLSNIMRKRELGLVLWQEEKSSFDVWAPHLLVWSVGFQMFSAVNSWRAQRGVCESFSTCSVSVESALQKWWKAAGMTVTSVNILFRRKNWAKTLPLIRK